MEIEYPFLINITNSYPLNVFESVVRGPITRERVKS